MKRVPLTDLGKPKSDDKFMELRFINSSGDTEVWMIRTSVLFGAKSIERSRLNAVKECTVVAYLDEAVDGRLLQQKMLLDKHSAHIQYHHDMQGDPAGMLCKFRSKSKRGNNEPKEAKR